MCAGAIQQARLKRVVYGATDPKAGAVESLYTILNDGRLNHQVEVEKGVLARECGALIQNFFQGRREEKNLKNLKRPFVIALLSWLFTTEKSWAFTVSIPPLKKNISSFLAALLKKRKHQLKPQLVNAWKRPAIAFVCLKKPRLNENTIFFGMAK